MPESREMTLQEVVETLQPNHSARREYDQLVSQDQVEECEASDPIDMGRAEMRVEILRLRDVIAEIHRVSDPG